MMDLKMRIVEAYIKEKTGKIVRIAFNDRMQFHRHLAMLEHAYSIANKYNNDKLNTTNKD